MRTPPSGIAELSRLNPSKSGDEQLLEGRRRPHEGRTERHLFLRLREHRRRVLFPVFVCKKGLEVLHIVTPVDEYALQLLKEFDRRG